MVNLDVDGYTKTLNHRKIIWKMQNNNLLKAKTILKPKYKLSGSRFSHLACQEGGKFDPLPRVSYVTGYDIWYLHTIG